MRRHPALLIIAWLTLGLAACDESGSQIAAPDSGEPEQDVASDTPTPEDTPAQDDTPEQEETGDQPDAEEDAPEEEVGPPEALSIALPQAVEGAMLANPEVYTELPIQILTTGAVTQVTVSLEGLGSMIPAVPDEVIDGRWVAQVPIDGVGEGDRLLRALATSEDGEMATAEANLALTRVGMQFTFYDIHGVTTTPRLHRVGESLWITWVDNRDGFHKAWLQQLSGAGRAIGDRILISPEDEPALYARVAFGTDSIGVLYQTRGGPYTNHLRVVELDGTERHAAAVLDPEDYFGSWGGDISFDGEAYVAAWRSNKGNGESNIYWTRVIEESGELAEPVLVAASGNGDPDGGFLPISFTRVEALGGRSVVTFVRGRYDNALEDVIPRSQAIVLDAQGNQTTFGLLYSDAGFSFHFEAHIHRIADRFAFLWTAVDLLDEEPNSPTTIFGTLADADAMGSPALYPSVPIIRAPGHRGEPVFIGAEGHGGVIAWTDERTNTDDDFENGHIELRAAHLDDALAPVDEIVFDHARFIAMTAQLGGVTLDTNALIVWIDERTGSGILNPRPEIFFETVW